MNFNEDMLCCLCVFFRAGQHAKYSYEVWQSVAPQFWELSQNYQIREVRTMLRNVRIWDFSIDKLLFLFARTEAAEESSKFQEGNRVWSPSMNDIYPPITPLPTQCIYIYHIMHYRFFMEDFLFLWDVLLFGPDGPFLGWTVWRGGMEMFLRNVGSL